MSRGVMVLTLNLTSPAVSKTQQKIEQKTGEVDPCSDDVFKCQRYQSCKARITQRSGLKMGLSI